MTSNEPRWSIERPDKVAERVRSWAVDVAGDDSPLYRSLGLIAADDSFVLTMIAEAPRSQPIVLPFLAAVHAMVAANPEEPLAAWYPSVSGTSAAGNPAPEFRAFCEKHHDEIVDLVRTRRVQTNEVGRCTLLLPALQLVAAMTSRELAMVEVGCSAGLNLRFDDYRYVYAAGDDTLTAGNQQSNVELTCTLTGSVPAVADGPPDVATRIGLDLNPLDVTNPDDAAWIRALVWPDQPHRHQRLTNALERAAADPPPIRAGNALVDLPPIIAELPAAAAACVVHTHVLNQFSPQARRDFDVLLGTLSHDRSVYRIASEWLHTPTPLLDLTIYEHGDRTHFPLGRADKHGAWLDWTHPASRRGSGDRR